MWFYDWPGGLPGPLSLAQLYGMAHDAGDTLCTPSFMFLGAHRFMLAACRLQNGCVTRQHAVPSRGTVSHSCRPSQLIWLLACVCMRTCPSPLSTLPFLLRITSLLDTISSISEHLLTCALPTAGSEVTLNTLISHGDHSTPLSLREAVAQHPVIQQSFQSMASASAVASAAARVEKECKV